MSFDPRAIEIRLNTSSMYARTIASAAKKHGMGNLDDLAPADYQRVQTITGNLLEMWEEGEHEEGFAHDDGLSTSSPKNATT